MQTTKTPGPGERPNKGEYGRRFFSRKNPQTLIDEAYHPDRAMKKALSAFDLIAFGIGAIIGSGIFALAGTAAAGQLNVARDLMSTPIINFLLGSPIGREGAGPAIVISFIVAAVACILAALCYAELASTIPVSGSAYTFAYAAVGQLAAWIIGWDLILEYAVGSVAVSVGWSGYFLHFMHGISGMQFPLWLTADTTTALARIASMTAEQRALYSSIDLPMLFGQPFAINVPAFGIVAFITGVLFLGISESSLMNKIMVVIKLAVVLFFIAIGSMYVNPSNWVPFAPNGLAGILGGAAIVFFAFIGFDAVSATAEEAKNPQRDLPIGIIVSLVVCTALYVAVALVLTGILPYTQYAGDAAPVATALASTGQPLGQILVTTGALAGITSVLLVLLFGQTRIFMAMSRDGLLPRAFSRIHPRFRTPYIPTILTGLAVGCLAANMDIGQAAELTNIGTLAAFVMVCAGVIMLRRLEPDRVRPFRTPWVPALPIAGMLACALLMISLPIVTWLRFIAWMGLGLVIYMIYGVKAAAHDRLPPEEV
jgi:basic amino acid/polyamine antiporter, APA family